MNNPDLGSCGVWGREIVDFALIKIEIIQEKNALKSMSVKLNSSSC